MEGTMDKVKKEAKRIYDLAMGNKKAAAIVVAIVIVIIILI
jgi:hypothetical protein